MEDGVAPKLHLNLLLLLVDDLKLAVECKLSEGNPRQGSEDNNNCDSCFAA